MSSSPPLSSPSLSDRFSAEQDVETGRHVQLQALRLLAALATLLPVLFGLFYRYEVPNAVDPLWGRALISTIPAVIFIASYLSGWIRDRFPLLLRLLMYGLLIWFVGLTIVNDFSPNYAIGLLFTFLALGIAVSVSVDTAAPVARFLGFATLLITGAVLWTRSLPVNPGIFITSTASLAVLLYVAVRTHLHTQQNLRTSEARFRAIFEEAGPGIAILDADRRLRDVNPAMERILQRDVDALRGTKLNALLHPDDLERDAEQFADLRTGRRNRYRTEQRFLTSDDSVVWAQFSVSPLPTETEDGTPRWVAFLVDVTDRKQLEDQLRQAQKMETVGTLAGGIAHDFNNILHSVKVYLEMTVEDLSPESTLRQYLARAHQGLKRAEELVQKLLTFSRQEGKSIEARFDLADVVQETIDLVTPALPNDVTLRTHLSEDTTVCGDPSQLHQVMTNLLTNAGQAMDETAPPDEENVLDVVLRTTIVGEDLARQYLNLDPGRYVRLTVSDTGPGMNAETREHIFEPFFTTKGEKGTGLGLSVVHGIVRAHNGEIAVFSEPGQGTTFSVFVPSADGTKDADPEIRSTPDERPTAHAHVLLVDEEEHEIDREAKRLRRIGFQVTPYQRAEDALQALDTTSAAYDLVLTNYATSGMSGVELAREVQQRHPDLPVVLTSRYSTRLSQEEVFQAGVDAFLRKPVGTPELEQVLDALTPASSSSPE